MPLLSIVIAAHNAADYLGTTLARLAGELCAVGDEVEALLLDDSSTDATSDIATRVAATHPWLRVMQVAHRNVGKVRQDGIAIARGQYIAFLDSDDAFMDGAIAFLLKLLRQRAPDVVLAPLREVADGSLHEAIPPAMSAKALTTAQAIDRFVEHRAIQGHLIGKCFARALLQRHPIPPLAAYEDMSVLPALLLDARRIVLLSAPFYLYLKRPGSLSCRRDWPRLAEQVAALEMIERTLLPRVPARRLAGFWIDLASALLASPDGTRLLHGQPAIVARVAGLPMLPFMLDPRVRTSHKRKLLQVRRQLRGAA